MDGKFTASRRSDKAYIVGHPLGQTISFSFDNNKIVQLDDAANDGRPSRHPVLAPVATEEESAAGVGGAAAAWPLAARAQQRERMRRIGVLMHLAADDPEGQSRLAAFLQGLCYIRDRDKGDPCKRSPSRGRATPTPLI
jgi:hypothetical protein